MWSKYSRGSSEVCSRKMPAPETLFSVGLLRSAYWISRPDFQNPSPWCGKKLKRAHSFHYQLQTTVMKKPLFWLFHLFLLLWLFVDLRKNLLYSKRGNRRWSHSNKNVNSPNFRKHTSQRPFGEKKNESKIMECLHSYNHDSKRTRQLEFNQQTKSSAKTRLHKFPSQPPAQGGGSYLRGSRQNKAKQQQQQKQTEANEVTSRQSSEVEGLWAPFWETIWKRI